MSVMGLCQLKCKVNVAGNLRICPTISGNNSVPDKIKYLRSKVEMNYEKSRSWMIIEHF